MDSYQHNNSRSGIDDDFANMEDVSETCDEGQRPHEAIDTCASRDTPLKRNALATKNKATYRSSKRVSRQSSHSTRNGNIFSKPNCSMKLKTEPLAGGQDQNKKEEECGPAQASEENKTPMREVNKSTNFAEASPAVTQFAQNPYMDLRTKPSNNFFNILTHQQSETTSSKRPSGISSSGGSKASQTSR